VINYMDLPSRGWIHPSFLLVEGLKWHSVRTARVGFGHRACGDGDDGGVGVGGGESAHVDPLCLFLSCD
jgi:hypothetical protein